MRGPNSEHAALDPIPAPPRRRTNRNLDAIHMSALAFVASAGRGLALAAPRALCARRRAPRMADTGDVDEAPPAAPATPADKAAAFEAPSFDTGVFSEFMEKTQAKVDELSERVQNIDGEEVVETAKVASMGLVDNALAGDWLNRGELYGAVQIAFVIALLRNPGLLDGAVGFVVGPLTLVTGAAVSAKALWDLGRKQLSIWPAPVPNGELKTEGIYEYVRHPVYSGLILASVGFAVATASPERFAITIALAAFLAKKIEVEEGYLSAAYPDYANYCDEVPSKLIPGIY